MPSISVNPSNNYFGMAAAMSSFFFFFRFYTVVLRICLPVNPDLVNHSSLD